MSEQEFKPDLFFSTIKDVHFGDGDLAIIYTLIEHVGNNQNVGNSTLPGFDINHAPFTIPGAGGIAPSMQIHETLQPDFDIFDGFYNPGPHTVTGIPSGALVPVTDTVTPAMIKAYKAWVGPFNMPNNNHTDRAPFHVLYCTSMGYMVINLSKMPRDKGPLLRFFIAETFNSGSAGTIMVATFKSSEKISKIVWTRPVPAAHQDRDDFVDEFGLTIISKSGTNYLGFVQAKNNGGKPFNATGFMAINLPDFGRTEADVTINLNTLDVQIVGGTTSP